MKIITKIAGVALLILAFVFSTLSLYPDIVADVGWGKYLIDGFAVCVVYVITFLVAFVGIVLILYKDKEDEENGNATETDGKVLFEAVQSAVSNAYENKYDWFIKIGNYKVMNGQILISSYILTPSYVSFKFMPANADVYADFIKKIKENCIDGKAEITAYCPNEHSYVKFNAYLIEPTPVIAYSDNGIPHCEATEIVFTLQEPTTDLEMYIMMKNIQMLLVGIKDSFRKGADSYL